MVEQAAGELAVDLDRLVADAVEEIATRVPDYTRALQHAGEDPSALVAGALGLMLQGLRDRDLLSRVRPVVREMGRTRSEVGPNEDHVAGPRDTKPRNLAARGVGLQRA